MYNIKKVNKISPVVYDHLPKSQFHVSSHLEDEEADGIVVRSANLHKLEFPERMLAIARAGAGTNNIPVDRATEKGIVVFNTPGANANGVKELVLGSMIATSRNLFAAYDWAKTLKGKEDKVPALVEKGKSQFVGSELKGKTLGVIGLGAIGIMVANSAADLGMDVIGYDPFLSVEQAWSISTKTHRAVELEELLAASDFISLHIPLTEETTGFFRTPEFSRMKKGVILMNFARGGLVKNRSLFDAMESGIVKKYVTDFPDSELIGHPGVIAIPHIGASTPESEENCAEMAAKQMHDFYITGTIVNSVNMPECIASPTNLERITVFHKNLPSMVGQITHAVGEHKINIADMVNKSRDGIGYTVMNLDADVPDKLLEQLNKIEGVIKVRKIENMK